MSLRPVSGASSGTSGRASADDPQFDEHAAFPAARVDGMTDVYSIDATGTARQLTTFGEQYRSMHLNQTFTGIAIGRPAGP